MIPLLAAATKVDLGVFVVCAVIVLTGVKAGEPESMTVEEREQRRQQLANQAARAELTGYAGNLRATANVRIPDDVLNPPVF